MDREYAFQKGELLEASVVSSLANTLNVIVLVEYKSGKRDRFTWRFTTADTRTTELFATNRVFHEDGRVLSATVRPDTASKRGQTYLGLYITPSPESALNYGNLCQGYVYSQHNLTLGEYIEPGPGGGDGFLSWVSLAADIAPIDVTRILATTNAFRKIYGFIWYYNASGDVATRTLDVMLRAMGLATPTGYTATTGAIWKTAAQDVIATGELAILAYNSGKGGDGLTSYNENGTLSQDSSATTPNPFPLLIEEDDLAELFFDVGSANANDRHSIYLLQEEWLKL